MRIQSLIVENFALISYCEISFPLRGFVAITGETGAGKTLIFDALDFVTGGRAHSSLIKHSAPECKVTGNFINESGELVSVSRAFTRSGDNKCFINGVKVKVAELSAQFANAFELTGQNEATGLFKPANHLFLLDAFRTAGSQQDDLLCHYQEIHQRLISLEKKLQNIEQGEVYRQREIDFCKFELEELNKYLPEKEKLFELEQEYKLLDNAQTIIEELQKVALLLNGSETENKGALDLLAEASKYLQNCVSLLGEETSLNEPLNDIEIAIDLIQNCSYQIKEFFNFIEPDSVRLDWLESLFNELNRLAKKHKTTIEQLYEVKTGLIDKLKELQSADQDPAQLREEIASLVQARQLAAEKLSQARQSTIKTMQEEIKTRLTNLNCPQVEFIIDLHPIPSEGTVPVFTNWGQDECEFLISLNPGEPVRSLSRVASGGEASRIFLALKSALAGMSGLETILFDEIDAGVGGESAQAVASELKKMGQQALVICVTHTPVVASFADQHWLVEKIIENRSTLVKVKKLEDTERVGELARMMGDRNSPTNLKRAHELLQLTERASKNEQDQLAYQ